MSLYDACHEAGGMSAYEWERDPKRLLFILARYQFVAKMLQGKRSVLEIGCADGFGSRVVRQHVGGLVAVDIEQESIDAAKRGVSARWPITFQRHDILAYALPYYDAVYCLDLFEHIADEELLLTRLYSCAPVCVIGTPSLESQKYASKLSIEGHVNCKSGEELRASCLNHWTHVFMFSANDEVVHTGFSPMAHYLFAVCVR